MGCGGQPTVLNQTQQQIEPEVDQASTMLEKFLIVEEQTEVRSELYSLTVGFSKQQHKHSLGDKKLCYFRLLVQDSKSNVELFCTISDNMQLRAKIFLLKQKFNPSMLPPFKYTIQEYKALQVTRATRCAFVVHSVGSLFLLNFLKSYNIGTELNLFMLVAHQQNQFFNSAALKHHLGAVVKEIDLSKQDHFLLSLYRMMDDYDKIFVIGPFWMLILAQSFAKHYKKQCFGLYYLYFPLIQMLGDSFNKNKNYYLDWINLSTEQPLFLADLDPYEHHYQKSDMYQRLQAAIITDKLDDQNLLPQKVTQVQQQGQKILQPLIAQPVNPATQIQSEPKRPHTGSTINVSKVRTQSGVASPKLKSAHQHLPKRPCSATAHDVHFIEAASLNYLRPSSHRPQFVPQILQPITQPSTATPVSKTKNARPISQMYGQTAASYVQLQKDFDEDDFEQIVIDQFDRKSESHVFSQPLICKGDFGNGVVNMLVNENFQEVEVSIGPDVSLASNRDAGVSGKQSVADDVINNGQNPKFGERHAKSSLDKPKTIPEEIDEEELERKRLAEIEKQKKIEEKKKLQEAILDNEDCEPAPIPVQQQQPVADQQKQKYQFNPQTGKRINPLTLQDMEDDETFQEEDDETPGSNIASIIGPSPQIGPIELKQGPASVIQIKPTLRNDQGQDQLDPDRPAKSTQNLPLVEKSKELINQVVPTQQNQGDLKQDQQQNQKETAVPATQTFPKTDPNIPAPIIKPSQQDNVANKPKVDPPIPPTAPVVKPQLDKPLVTNMPNFEAVQVAQAEATVVSEPTQIIKQPQNVKQNPTTDSVQNLQQANKTPVFMPARNVVDTKSAAKIPAPANKIERANSALNLKTKPDNVAAAFARMSDQQALESRSTSAEVSKPVSHPASAKPSRAASRAKVSAVELPKQAPIIAPTKDDVPEPEDPNLIAVDHQVKLAGDSRDSSPEALGGSEAWQPMPDGMSSFQGPKLMSSMLQQREMSPGMETLYKELAKIEAIKAQKAATTAVSQEQDPAHQ